MQQHSMRGSPELTPSSPSPISSRTVRAGRRRVCSYLWQQGAAPGLAGWLDATACAAECLCGMAFRAYRAHRC